MTQLGVVIGCDVFYFRARPDGVPDILDTIQNHGGIRAPGPRAGGEYDGYSEAMTGPATVLRRSIKSGRGLPADIMLELVKDEWPRIQSPDDMWQAIQGACKSRSALYRDLHSLNPF